MSSRRFGLFFQRFKVVFQLGYDEIYTVDFAPRSVEFLYRFRSLYLGFGNAYRLFEYTSSVGGFGLKYLGDFALSYNRISLFGYTALAEIIDDVPKSRKLSVDVVFALARSVKFTGENDFRIIEVFKYLVRVIENERNFAVRQSFSVLRTAENYVLHARTSHRLRGLFAENPFYGVRDVTLSAAVRSYYTSNSVFKRYLLLVGERFETYEFYSFKIH